MIRAFPPQEPRPHPLPAANASRKSGLRRAAGLCAVTALLVGTGAAQITVNTKTGEVTNNSTGTSISTIDRRYQQITPTHVPLAKSELDAKTRQELIRLMQAEQGFAMRPFPRGHKGLTLVANGNLEPAGERYLEMVTSEGMSAKPGDRVVVTDVKFERSRVVFELNGGPDAKHRFLRHVQIGAGPDLNPVVQDKGQEPVGARLTLTFQDHVPELTGKDVKALLAPLISFDFKTPIQAYTDTLPAKLKEAILDHRVMVGMNTDMVLFAKGQPESKTREMDGQMPFEEWIYGRPPQDVEFVRINGNHVIRLEVARMGQTPVIFTRDEVAGLMRTDGTPLDSPSQSHTRTVAEGDARPDLDKQAPAAAPSLRNPGEKLPNDDDRTQVMKPVHFPKQKPEPQPGANPDEEQSSASPSAQPPPSGPPSASAGPAKPQSPPAGASQPN